MSPTTKKPLEALFRSVNKRVTVKLKSEYSYRGRVLQVDSYMNLTLADAEEFNANGLAANYGLVVIRGNNVLFVKLDDEV